MPRARSHRPKDARAGRSRGQTSGSSSTQAERHDAGSERTRCGRAWAGAPVCAHHTVSRERDRISFPQVCWSPRCRRDAFRLPTCRCATRMRLRTKSRFMCVWAVPQMKSAVPQMKGRRGNLLPNFSASAQKVVTVPRATLWISTHARAALSILPTLPPARAITTGGEETALGAE